MLTMRDAIDRFFDQAIAGDNGMNTPKVDVMENENNIVVKAELPGFAADDIDVRVEGNMLSLRGECREEHEKKEGQYHLRERSQQSFSRILPLPSDVNAEAAKADFDNGILTLSLPKTESSKAKRINISTKTR